MVELWNTKNCRKDSKHYFYILYSKVLGHMYVCMLRYPFPGTYFIGIGKKEGNIGTKNYRVATKNIKRCLFSK